MWVGCFGELVFSVSNRRIFTPDSISGSAGSEWAAHNTIGGKPKSEKTGVKLKKNVSSRLRLILNLANHRALRWR